MAIFTFEDTVGDAALLDVHVSSNGLQDDWRGCKTIIRIKSNYTFHMAILDETNESRSHAHNTSNIELILDGNSELRALARIFRSSADFLDYVCRQTNKEYDNDL